ncbi:MAG: pyridoxal-phosphate dependent enzyme [Anaerolineales bacterium]|nr:pyridoxal-phosphate dependent enzyme [Anaerolineales bacterium]
MVEICCTNCRSPYPNDSTPYKCPRCGGVYDYSAWPTFDAGLIDPALPGVWKYRAMFGLPESAPVASLGEGNTPLLWLEVDLGEGQRERLGVKCEMLNPTASFKDRGSALLVSFLRSRGITATLEDSSGNAGASLAAYAARAGMEARIFAPDSASGKKLAQIQAYGAALSRVPGPRSNAAQAVQQVLLAQPAQGEAAYASHAYLPFNLPGYATLAYELAEQLGGAPGTVICPTGQGGLLLGIGRGFNALLAARAIQQAPLLVGVQALACAPLWAVSTHGRAGLAWVSEGDTLAEGIRVRNPVRGDAVIDIVESSGGFFHAVSEEAILQGRVELARRGFYIEPTSAVIWEAALNHLHHLPKPAVAVLTGSGLKV